MKTRLPFIRPSTQISRPDRPFVISSPTSATRRAICSSLKSTEMLSFMPCAGTMIRLSSRDWHAFRGARLRCVKRASRPPGSGSRRPDGAGTPGEPEQPVDVSAVDSREAPGLEQGLPQRRAGHGHGRAGECFAVEDERVAVTGRGPRQRALRHAAHVARLLGDQVRRPRERLAHARIEALLQVRQELVPHAVARVGRIGVRLVLAPGETALREVREHLAARDREQRAQQVAAREPHAGETGRTAAAQQPQQQRLGLVVPGVRDGDRHGALVVLDPAQEGVALAARRLLEAALLGARALADAAAPGAQRHAERGAQLVTEGGVVGGAGPQAVVEVRGDELEAAAAAERRERVQERHGVGAAGEGDEQRLAARGPPGREQGAVDGRDEERASSCARAPPKCGLVAVQGFEPRTPRI